VATSRPDSILEVQLLGTFRVLRRGGPDVVLRPSGRRLVALLALGGPQARVDAAGQLWPEIGTHRALANLRTVLWRTRQDCRHLIVEQPDNCHLGAVAVDSDSVRLWASRTIHGDYGNVPEKATRELLPSWGEGWLVQPREEYRLLQLHALELSAQRFMMGGSLAEASVCAQAAIRLDPFRESAHRLLLEVTLREGNQVEALRQFRRVEKLLSDEAGLSPGPAMLALISSVRPHRDEDSRGPGRDPNSTERVWRSARSWRGQPP
jgi:DNA-binding SARP family transcriptional activator